MKNHPFTAFQSVWLWLLFVVVLTVAACGEDQTKINAIGRHKGGVLIELPEMPEDAIQTKVDLNDLNFWSEGEYFYVVGLVDDQSNTWSRVWLKIRILDENDEALSFDGNIDIIVPTFSDALPPRGRTSFFSGFPLSKIKGKPAKIVVMDALAKEVERGAVLIPSGLSGVMMLTQAKPGDSVATVESGWAVSAFVENPVPEYTCDSLRGEWLVYGKDEKLYISILTIGHGDNPSLLKEHPGPLRPGDKLRVGASILYANVPRVLDSVRIGRVDFQPFDSRPFIK